MSQNNIKLIELVRCVLGVTLNDDICAFTVVLANLAAFALNFNGVSAFLASWSSDCSTSIVEGRGNCPNNSVMS